MKVQSGSEHEKVGHYVDVLWRKFGDRRVAVVGILVLAALLVSCGNAPRADQAPVVGSAFSESLPGAEQCFYAKDFPEAQELAPVGPDSKLFELPRRSGEEYSEFCVVKLDEAENFVKAVNEGFRETPESIMQGGKEGDGNNSEQDKYFALIPYLIDNGFSYQCAAIIIISIIILGGYLLRSEIQNN